MKTLAVIVLLASIAAAFCSCISAERDVSTQERQFFESWKRQHNKYYRNYEDERRAMLNVLAEKKDVEEHNRLYEQGRKSYSIGLNEHSDLSEEEFHMHLLGYDDDDSQSSRLTHTAKFPAGPDYVNWTSKGLVGPVENQKHCGACWAFSTAGIVNAVLLKKNKNAELVSPQQLIDCDHHRAHGCHGGSPSSGLRYVKSNGIASEKSYPFTEQQGSCEASQHRSVGTISEVKEIITNGDEELLKDIVASVGPISISLCADKLFKKLRSGFFSEPDCCTSNNHAPMITGYGTDPTFGDYWIVKNSWGTSWGENGYAKVARNSGNMCNIAKKALWAV